MFIIGKTDEENKSSYLYENHSGRYLFDSMHSNVRFKTFEAASNFLSYNEDHIKKLVSKNENLFIREDKDLKVRVDND